MKKIVFSCVALLLTFSISVLLHMPAHFAVNFFLYKEGRPIYPEINLAGVSGSIWEGEADNFRWRQYKLGKLSWQLQLSELMRGKLEYKLTFGAHDRQISKQQLNNSQLNLLGKGEVGISFWGTYIENTFATLPASELFNLLFIENTVFPISVTGDIELTLKQRYLSDPFCFSLQQTVSQSASQNNNEEKPFATLVWLSGAVETSIGQLNLDGLTGELKCEDNRLNLLSDYQNDQLEFNGNVSLSGQGQYQLDAWLKANQDFPELMRQQLHWLGEADSQARYQLSYQGEWY